MSVYLRKSVNVGPFRFNFSKSGVGISAGINGLRVGTGPRGNYITVGRGGLYYRATLPKEHINAAPQQNNQIGIDQQLRLPQENATVGPMVSIESSDVSAMQDSTATELLLELNKKRQRSDYWKWIAVPSIAVLWVVVANQSITTSLVCAIVLAILTSYIAIRDAVAKTVILCYNLDAQNEKIFNELIINFSKIMACKKIWRINAKGKVHDSKYHAGASSLVTREEISFRHGLPPHVKSNIDVPSIKTPKISLYFMPDCILAYSENKIGAISYKNFQVNNKPSRFIEESPLPSDAQVIDRTWKYVNKKGGPDKRFKDNREIPVALYDEITFTSDSGLHEVFQASRHSITNDFNGSLGAMVKTLPE